MRKRSNRQPIRVSIPFSSGRRRHPEKSPHSQAHSRNLFQSPSHRGGGATGASCCSIRPREPCFNPLLIGEAAPPVQRVGAHLHDRCVSIPFSSGRRRHRFIWSMGIAKTFCFNPLLIGEAAPPQQPERCSARAIKFQSPSHRGGGATGGCRARDGHGDEFQSPSHRGGGATLAISMFASMKVFDVSIPFSSGRRRHR